MSRKQLIILILCIATMVAATIGYGIYYMQTHEGENEILSTNNDGYAIEEIPHADSLIVGKWQNSNNPQWYKVYYDDYDEDERLFWGKEWDESEDVYEEDLNYHGNGWFRWEKKSNTLYEYATMDARDVPIAKLYTLLFSSTDSLAYCEQEHKQYCFHFSKVK